MKKSLIISEADNIAALLENDRVVEFFVNRGELLLGDVYTATVENILPGIDAAFVNLGKDKMGFLHANDVPGQGSLKEKLVPKQKLLVQITKEPTGHKGPRVSTAISLPGRFLVLVPEERGVSISRRISEAKERARLKALVNLMKPPGVGLIIRTEAKGQGEQELFEDFEGLWDRWQTIVSDGEASIGPTLIYRDQDLLFRVIRDAYSNDINEIIVDTAEGQKRALDYMQGWASRNTKVLQHVGDDPLLINKGIDHEIEAALSDRVELPSGGHLNIQPTEALTVIDVNSGRFTSSRTQAETVRRTNVEAAQEIPRQLRIRNIGGMVIVDFIDMDSRRDQQQVLEQFQRALEDDRAKPQIGQLSDLGLVELTRRRQGQSLRELFTSHCTSCSGLGIAPTLELGFGEHARLLSLRKDDDLLRGRRRGGQGGRQQTPVLRSATVGGGRIKPTLIEAIDEIVEDLESLPEEILSQVPEELLAHQHAFGKVAHVSLDDNDDEEEIRGGRDRHFGEETRENAYNRGPLYSARHEDFEESEPVSRKAVDTAVTIEEEAVKPSTSGRQLTLDLDDDDEEEVVVAKVVAKAAPTYAREPVQATYSAPEVIDAEEAEEVEEVPELEIPESPFETEIDPVTGIYRLKAKPQQQAENGSESSSNSYGTATATQEQPAHEHHEQRDNYNQFGDTAQQTDAHQEFGTANTVELAPTNQEQSQNPDWWQQQPPTEQPTENADQGEHKHENHGEHHHE